MAALFASKTLHGKLLSNILRCPMSFFETTPLGRILNRFSLDIFIIDETIPTTIQSFLYRILSAIGVLLVVSVATPMFIAVIVPLGVFYCGTQVRKLSTSFVLHNFNHSLFISSAILHGNVSSTEAPGVYITLTNLLSLSRDHHGCFQHPSLLSTGQIHRRESKESRLQPSCALSCNMCREVRKLYKPI